MSYYRHDHEELCAYYCGDQSYCGSGGTCSSSCMDLGFLYGSCGDGYLSLTILYLVYALILRCFSIVTCLVFVVTPMALDIRRPVHQQLRPMHQYLLLGMHHAKIRVSLRIRLARFYSGRLAQQAALMAFHAAFTCKKDPMYLAAIVLIISYYRTATYYNNFCAFNCGSQSYCGTGYNCATSCISAGFLYGWCTDG
jgi:hypothetical protein